MRKGVRNMNSTTSPQPPRPKHAMAKKRSRGNRKGMCLGDRPLLEPNAAGIDIGAREIFVAVPPDRDPNPVRSFPAFTEDLQQLAEWLESAASPRQRWNRLASTGSR